MGLKQDYKIAHKYYEKARSLGSKFSSYMVGNFELMGYGTEKNVKKAYQIFSELVKSNFSHASNGLGYMYQHGIHVK